MRSGSLVLLTVSILLLGCRHSGEDNHFDPALYVDGNASSSARSSSGQSGMPSSQVGTRTASPDDQLRKRHEARLNALPAGSYVNYRGAKCGQGFRDHKITINTHISPTSGEILQFCVPANSLIK